MPTLEHNGLVAMFRENPPLAPHLIETLFHLPVPPYATVKVVEASLDQLIPIEFRADLVLELLNDNNALVLSIVLEVQRDEAARKKFSWPVYVAVARAEKERPAVVLVVAPDADVATWAAEKIDLGLGRGIIAAMTHGNGPNGLAVVLTALGAMGRLDREHAAVYFQIIYNVLREPMRRALEALVMQRQAEGEIKFPPFAQEIFERGELKGELKGKLEGKLEGKRDALLRLLARAGIALTDDERSRIAACTDAATLDRWFDNAFGAKSASDVLC